MRPRQGHLQSSLWRILALCKHNPGPFIDGDTLFTPLTALWEFLLVQARKHGGQSGCRSVPDQIQDLACKMLKIQELTRKMLKIQDLACRVWKCENSRACRQGLELSRFCYSPYDNALLYLTKDNPPNWRSPLGFLLMLEPAKSPENDSSPKEACFSSLCLNGCQALSAGLTGAAFDEMWGFFVPLLNTKDILRWCSSEALL